MDEDTAEQAGEPDDARVYRWAMRGLYAAAIIVNVWLLVDQINEANPTRLPLLKAKATAWLRRQTAPLRASAEFQRQVNRVIYEATEAVENA